MAQNHQNALEALQQIKSTEMLKDFSRDGTESDDCIVVFAVFNLSPIKPSVSYLIGKCLRPLNYQRDQNIVEKPVVHDLIHAFCHRIDSLYFLATFF